MFVAATADVPNVMALRMAPITDGVVTFIVAALLTALDDMVAKLGEVPLMFKAPTVCVVPNAKVFHDGPLMFSVPNVFDPVIAIGAPERELMVSVPYDKPPPLKLCVDDPDVALKTNLALEKFAVNPVVVAQSKLSTLKVNVPLPRFIVLVPEPPNSIAITPAELPNVMLGLFTLKSSVPVNAPAVSVAIVAPLTVESTVTVPPPELASNVTLSPDAGTLEPPAPPEDADQCVVVVESQVPAPPTQNLAIFGCPYLKYIVTTSAFAVGADGSVSAMPVVTQ